MRLRSVVIPGRYEPYPAVVIEDLEVTVYYDISDRGTIIFKRIEADDITSDTIRAIKIGELRPAIRRMLLEDPSRVGGLAFFHAHGDAASTQEEQQLQERAHTAAVEAVNTLRHKTPGRGRAAQNDAFYRKVALIYLELYPVHGQKTAKAVASQLGATQSTVYGWIRRAREEKWLSLGEQGRAGALPGLRLDEWLKEQT